jgi:hypothetical protein
MWGIWVGNMQLILIHLWKLRMFYFFRFWFVKWSSFLTSTWYMWKYISKIMHCSAGFDHTLASKLLSYINWLSKQFYPIGT